MTDTDSNVSQLKNPDISGGIFTLSLSILILNSNWPTPMALNCKLNLADDAP